MRILAIVILAACTGGGSSSGDDTAALLGCPDPSDTFPEDCRMAVGAGDSCSFDASGTALAGECTCTDTGFWVCNSCPFFWTPVAPLDACTPNTTCEINSWEHGCSCGCTVDGEWSCYPLTINSQCPQ